MKPRSKSILWIMLLASGVVLISSVRYLGSRRFEEKIRLELVKTLEQATGFSCSIDHLHLSLWQREFVVRGLAMRDRSSPPVFQLNVEEAIGTLRPISILKLDPRLADVTLVRPRLTIAAAGGGSEWDPRELLQAFRKSLDFAVGTIRVSEGIIQAGNRRIPIDGSLNDFACEIEYQPEVPGYRVRLAYRNGRVGWRNREILYGLNVRARLSMNGLDIDSVGIQTGKSYLSGEGWMRDWKSPVLMFHVAGAVDSPDLAVFERHLERSSGGINLLANLKWDAGGFHATGRFSASGGSYQGVPVDLRDGFMEIRNGVLWFRDVHGRLGSATFQSNAAFSLSAGQTASHTFDIELKRVVLRDAAKILSLPQLDYDNSADGVVHIKWRAGSEDLVVHSSLQLNRPRGAVPSAGRNTDLEGRLAFDYAKGNWYFPNVDLRSASTEISATGKGASGYSLHLRTSRIAEPLGIIQGFSDTVDGLLRKYPDLPAIAGTYELDGDIGANATNGLAYRGAVRIRGGSWRSYVVDSLTANASWNGTELRLRPFELHKGDGFISGSLDLTPQLEGAGPMRLSYRGSCSHIPAGWLKDFGADIAADLKGTLSGSGLIANTNGQWQGDGEVLVEKGSFREEAFDSLRARARFEGQVLQIADCEVKRDHARLNLEGRARLDTNEMDFRIRLAGLTLGSLPGVRSNQIEIDGKVSGSGELRGTFQDPAGTARLELEGLQYGNWELGRGQGTVEFRNRKLHGDILVESGFGGARLKADISMEPGYPGSAHMDLNDWNAQKLIAGNLPPVLSGLSTAMQGSLDIEGSFATPSSLNLVGEIDGARFKIQEFELHNSGKVRLLMSNRKLEVKEARIVGEDTNLVLNGVIPTDGSESMDLRLDGSMSLKILEHLERRIQTSGSAGISVRATGPLLSPQVVGQAVLNDVRLGWGDLPARISSLQGKIIFSRNLLRLESIHGTTASGSVQVSGAIEHQAGQLKGLNLQIGARQVSFAYPKDFRTVADADLNLRGGADSQVLAGEVRVTRADYLRGLNLLEQLASRSSMPPGAQASDPLLAGLRFNVAINSTDGLYIDNDLTRLRGGMHLTLHGTPAYPSLIGRVEVTTGSIFFRGNRFEITRASADFLDRNRINPVLEVRAEADVRSYRMLLDVSGDLDHLRINVTSDPPMSSVDILTMLTTGKAVEPGMETSRRQSEITGLSAASILSESLTGVIGKRVQRIFGLQTFRVDPFLAGAENDPTARVTISERLSRDLNVTFSRNLSTNEEQIVIVEYDVSRNLSIVATRDENGKFGLDFRFRKRFR